APSGSDHHAYAGKETGSPLPDFARSLANADGMRGGAVMRLNTCLPPAFPPGLFLKERYRVLPQDHEEQWPRRYRVADMRIEDTEMEVLEYPLAADTTAQAWETLRMRLQQ